MAHGKTVLPPKRKEEEEAELEVSETCMEENEASHTVSMYALSFPPRELVFSASH